MARQNKKVTTRKQPVSRKTVKRAKKQPLFLPDEHTFRLRHSRHTSYPLVLLLMLLVGLLLFNWTSFATGLDYSVNAKVPAPALTEPATILTPTDGSVLQTTPTEVNGRCPVGSYVKLSRNGFFSGVALCQPDGMFHIQTDLFVGANELIAQDYNITDDSGPASSPVTVQYKPRVSVAPIPTTSNPESPTAPFIIGSEFLFKGYHIGQSITWQFTLTGGNSPYAVHIDWGDGTGDTLSRNSAGEFGVSHTYVKATSRQNSYVIKAQASDGAGHKAFVQLLAIVNPDAAAASTVGSGSGGIGSTSTIGNFLKVVWPTYGVSLLVLGGFWLGERREFELLHPVRKRHV